jgi:serine O-acetyltransferase
MDDQFLSKVYMAHQNCHQCPSSEEIARFFNSLVGVMFPNFVSQSLQSIDDLDRAFDRLKLELKHLLRGQDHLKPTEITEAFFQTLPHLYDMLLKDVDAMYAGDPAANSHEEVIRSYPGFYAIAAYRIAHALHELDVDILPRSITEHAHSKGGIDIHPGARIGSYFCIDHGTGVVIGETAEIGNHVKIYQGVTLGALSVEKELANTKRHPTIEDHVVIYSGASILGGRTVIGEGSLIGGNVWLVKSVPAGSKVYYQSQVISDGQFRPDATIIK